MNIAKALWAMVEDDPKFMRRINGWATLFWAVMIPISFAAGWIHSVTFISVLSLWSLVSGHLAAYQAARVEVLQQKQADEHAA